MTQTDRQASSAPNRSKIRGVLPGGEHYEWAVKRAQELWEQAEREGRIREHFASCPCGAMPYQVRYIAGWRPFAWLRAETGRLVFLARHWRHRG